MLTQKPKGMMFTRGDESPTSAADESAGERLTGSTANRLGAVPKLQ